MLERLAIYTVIGVLLIGIAGTWHHNRVEKAVEAARSSLTQKYSDEYVLGLESSLKASGALLADALKDKETLENEKTALSNTHKLMVDGLRNRASRAESKASSTNITAAPIVVTCTGAELSREDAEFLAGEAARAEAVLKDRDFYYKRYEDARNKVEKLNKEIRGNH